MVLLMPGTKSMDFLIILITFLILLMPSISSSQYLGNILLTHRKILPNQEALTSYAVMFDAGSSGTRVHVFHFDQNLDLLHIGKSLEFLDKIKPGLSSYADNPKKAAESLIPLLKEAQGVVPEDQQPKTPVRLGVVFLISIFVTYEFQRFSGVWFSLWSTQTYFWATAGLRLLDGDASARILQEVKDMLRNRSTFNLQPDAVTIIDGTQEGSYLWVAVNYLLGKLGNKFPKTVGVVDLGGASVQMTYAVSKNTAKNAPKVSDGEDPYIKKLVLKGKKYDLYAHSYLRYGKDAARAEILKVTRDSANPCVLAGFDGIYTYAGVDYMASASLGGSNFDKCRKTVLKALKVNKSCPHKNCTFNGIWNGGGGSGQKNLVLTSSFYYLAEDVGFIDKPSAILHPMDYEKVAKRACETTFEDAYSTYPRYREKGLQFICMDLTYQYTLLVHGFGLDPWKEVTVAKLIEYQDALVEAAWPLGSAIEAISSLPKFERLMYFI